jgi:hypothetical protein
MSELGPCAGCGRAASAAKAMFPARATSGAPFLCDRCVAECVQAVADAPTRIPGSARGCSFCAKPEDQVAIMIAVGASMICDECVDHYRSRADAG